MDTGVTVVPHCRYLVPADINVGKFVYEIRKHMKLTPEKAIYLFVNGVLPPTAALMSQVPSCIRDVLQLLTILPSISCTNATKMKMGFCT